MDKPLQLAEGWGVERYDHILWLGLAVGKVLLVFSYLLYIDL